MIDLNIEDIRWTAHDLAGLAETGIRAALDITGFDTKLFEVSVLGCDDTRIVALNADFRDKPTPTNVLSWPAFDLTPPATSVASFTPESLGDIAISFDTCTREAATGNKNFNHHVTHLMLHGCLHLLGYDHENDTDAAIMEGLEVKALAKLGIANPY